MLKYIFPNKLVQAINNDELSQTEQLALLTWLTILKGGVSSLSPFFGCSQPSSTDFLFAFGLVGALFVAFVANGGRLGNGFAMKYATLALMLALWLFPLCWIGLFIMAEGAYYVLHQDEIALFINKNSLTIYAWSFLVFYLIAIWHYFSKFRHAGPSGNPAP